MDAFTALHKYYGSNVGNMGRITPTMREESAKHPAVADDADLVRMEKDLSEEAVKTAIDHGFNPDSPEGKEKIQRILESIKRKEQNEAGSPEKMQGFEKARPRKETSPYLDPNRGETATSDPEVAKKAWGIVFRRDPSLKGDVREEMRADWRPGMGPKPKGSRAWAAFSRMFERLRQRGEKPKDEEKAIIAMEKAAVSPALANLLAAAAGWALSGDIAGKVDPNLAQEWDRATSNRDKKRLQEEMMRQMHRIRRKSMDSDNAFGNLQSFYKQDDDEDIQFNEYGEVINGFEEDDPQMKGWGNAISAHGVAEEAGWGGKEHDLEDFHPETGELQGVGQGANHIRDWAKGLQEQHGIPLVGGPTGGEPHDDIYNHYGIKGGHMSGTSITPQHIADYVKNKTGADVSPPGTQPPSVQNMLKHIFLKDHAPVPPRYGLMWDAVKHRWTRPEKVGRTVWEVQGHKRFRGTGTGAHERGRATGGTGGYGVGSAEAGRRFRSVGDVGRLHPHESKHPGQRTLKRLKRTTKKPRR